LSAVTGTQPAGWGGEFNKLKEGLIKLNRLGISIKTIKEAAEIFSGFFNKFYLILPRNDPHISSTII